MCKEYIKNPILISGGNIIDVNKIYSLQKTGSAYSLAVEIDNNASNLIWVENLTRLLRSEKAVLKKDYVSKFIFSINISVIGFIGAFNVDTNKIYIDIIVDMVEVINFDEIRQIKRDKILSEILK